MNRPNIVLLFCDQLRYDALAANGNTVVKTPVIDELARDGISFDAAYTPCPVCVPARFSMHTGLLPHKTGVYENTQIPTGRTSFMEILRDNGYQTFGAGKMHFTFESGINELWGFDERATCESQDRSANDFLSSLDEAGYTHVHDAKGVRSEMYYVPQVSQLPPELHHTAWTVNESISFLERRDTSKPFFLMTSFEKPHPPFEPPVPWNKLYRGPDMPEPKVPGDSDGLLTLWNRFQNRYKYRDQGFDLNLIRQMKAHYYAEVSFIDYSVGRLVERMRELGVYEDTLIIFTADHGELLGDYRSFGKRCFLDSAAQIPLILRVPGQAGGSRCDAPVTLVDLMPTLLDAAGIDQREERSGESLLRIASGELERDAIVGQYEQGPYASYMLRTADYKYIYSVPDEKEFLFDLVHDPAETRNRALNPSFTAKTREMRDRLIEYFRKEGYEDPIENNAWRKHGLKTMPEDPDAYLLFQDPPGSIPRIPGYETDSNSRKYFEFHWYEDHYDSV
jgi:choline-sulfatase